MSLILLGATSGSVTLQEPAVAGTTVIDLPTTSGTMAVTSGSPSFTNITATGNLTVNGNTTLGDASTDTILMTGAPSIGGAGLGMGMGFRNRIINGAMVIDQRNAGASVTPANTGQYLVDRWSYNGSQASKFTAQQNAGAVTPPAGFINYQGVTSSSAYSLISSDYFQLYQPVEGLNVADLAWGSLSAATVTLSFWVRSSLTGTFGGSLRNSALNRSYPFSYTISAANTWEQKAVTIAGDTTGTWLTTNGIGIYLAFSLGSGSTFSGTAGTWAAGNLISATGATSVVGTNGATFYITGVQLEKGSTATSFDYRPYGTELLLCQRYLPAWASSSTAEPIANGAQFNTIIGLANFIFPVQTRVSPTGLIVSNASHFSYNAGNGSITATAVTLSSASTKVCNVNFTIPASGAVGYAATTYFNNASGLIYFTGCEL